MKDQKVVFHMKEQDNPPEKQLNQVERGKLSLKKSSE